MATARPLDVSSARPVGTPGPATRSEDSLAIALLRDGLIRPEDLIQSLSAQSPHQKGRLIDLLLSRSRTTEEDLLRATARHFGVSFVDPCAPLPDPRLIDQIGAADCLRMGLVPWRQAGAATIVATARPEDFHHLRPRLELALGPVLMAVCTAAAVENAIHSRRGARLARAAENRVAESESARSWGRPDGLVVLIFAGLVIATLIWLSPLLVLRGLLALALLTLALSTALKLAAGLAALRRLPPEPPLPLLACLPQVSVIVALYRESDIAPRLIRRLSRLDYPRELLDVVLAVEAEDTSTRAALGSVALPPWMRVVTVPAGRIKTKPRALNLALDHCRGDIIGIYDAEDAPEPDQIRKVVQRFYNRGPEVACLQGMLDYYNPRTNWMSRCFTIEYATWFRLILPGIARLGLAVPLGGTTLFFRRAVIEELGGWDAHNVTEDADLGIRLSRHGYRTELLDTVTGEEANCRVIPWIKQRSRWIKGYMMTWAVHMRQPALLWRQLGPRRFIGFQIMFAGSILQSLLAPLLWSFWVLPLGLWHPLAASMALWVFWAMIALFLLSEAVNITLGIVALKRTGHHLSPLWVVSLHLYFPLAVLAAYKGLWEMIARPFYWDKTHHGIYDPVEAMNKPR
jgi:cellulose synthase/poly-beta-1,6-N-acetylglucosamine synthase-like glycosyltransferase